MFKKGCFSYNDFLNLLPSCRNASAPGLNGISYKVYKKYSKLSKFLFQIFKCAFSKGEILLQWRSAREIYIPKLKTPSENVIFYYQTIAFLNLECKLFFSLISKWLLIHLAQNNRIINSSVQKGCCMEKVPGCWEHLSMFWSVLEEARVKKSLAVAIWLDIANANGSVPHKLIFFALWRYGILNQWIQIIELNHVGIFSKSFSESTTSS